MLPILNLHGLPLCVVPITNPFLFSQRVADLDLKREAIKRKRMFEARETDLLQTETWVLGSSLVKRSKQDQR
ncbi:hypothetical protein GIB67_030269 [Kingdonia uniflora]|uniref:Uncharacterized protein n=1 Tax=Kingdonia uniflora TaxID=39325 RepID=A0A7J7M6S8_9MAGN|nr:hypothetical protein GIB67_030269 [Kingdonia uniflora]